MSTQVLSARFSIWLLGLSITATCASATAALVQIELPTSTEVSGRSVALGEVAYLTSTDLGLLRRLLVLPLGAAPERDTSVTLDRAALVRWLRVRAGLSSHDIQWMGERQVTISRASRPVASSELVAAAKGVLSEWLEERSERFEVHPVTDPRSLVVPKGALRLAVRPLGEGRPARRMQVWVDVWSNNETVRSVPITFEVKAYATAAVATRDLALGSAATESIANQEVDLTAWPARSRHIKSSELSTVDAPRLRRPLRTGDVVTTADVEVTPAVQRGDWATVRVRDGALELESKVEVLHDAWIGQNVRVRSSQTEQPVLARVIGRGQLEIQP